MMMLKVLIGTIFFSVAFGMTVGIMGFEIMVGTALALILANIIAYQDVEKNE